MIFVSLGHSGGACLSRKPTDDALAFPVPECIGADLDLFLMQHSLSLPQDEEDIKFSEIVRLTNAFYSHDYVKRFIKIGTLESLTWIEISTAWLAVLREPIEGVSEALRRYLRHSFAGGCLSHFGGLIY